MTQQPTHRHVQVSLAATAGVALACGVGWLLLSWLVMREPFGDAAGEALGVVFGVLILLSVLGVLRRFSRRNGDSGGDPEKSS